MKGLKNLWILPLVVAAFIFGCPIDEEEYTLKAVELTAGPAVDVDASGTTAQAVFTGASGLILTAGDFTVTGDGTISSVEVSGNSVAVTVSFEANTGAEGKTYIIGISPESTVIKGTAAVTIIHTAPQTRPGYFIGADGQEWPDPDATDDVKTGNFWFIAPNGSDTDGDGTKENPWFSINKAQTAGAAGDTVYIRGGIYYIGNDIGGKYTNYYMTAFVMNKSGNKNTGGSISRINYFGYPGERPVFDMSGFDQNTDSGSGRFAAFQVSGSYLHFKNFEVIGLQQTYTGSSNTQSINIYNRGGSENIYENLAMHDGMGIGFYMDYHPSKNNLVLNCDAYGNWDWRGNGGKGENNDGFGAHATAEATGTVFRGCRAWLNADDGFDLITQYAPVTVENCWAFYNGYIEEDPQSPGVWKKGANGTGFKAGGYGMESTRAISYYPAKDTVPRHIIRFCLAAGNLARGFYANHHLGGNEWYNNTAYDNPVNFEMRNRDYDYLPGARDLPDGGEGHVLINNVSYKRTAIIEVNRDKCEFANNSFDPQMNMNLTNDDFQSLDLAELLVHRNPDGSLPDVRLLRPSMNSKLRDSGAPTGFSYKGMAPDIGYAEY
jgi:hypothetical protein